MRKLLTYLFFYYRIMVLNLLNLYSLIFAQFDKIEGMTLSLEQLKPNLPWNQVTEASTISTIILATEMTYLDKDKISTSTTIENKNSTMFSNNITQNCYEVTVTCNSSHHHVSEFKFHYDYSDTTISNEENSTNKPKSNLSLWFNFHNENVDSFNYTFDYEDYDITVHNETDIQEYNISTLLPSLYYDYISKFTKSRAEMTTELDSTLNSTEQSKSCFILVCDNITSDSSKIAYLKSDDLQLDITTGDIEASNITTKRPELNMETRRKLRKLCWETNFGQELAKLTVMDLVSSF